MELNHGVPRQTALSILFSHGVVLSSEEMRERASSNGERETLGQDQNAKVGRRYSA